MSRLTILLQQKALYLTAVTGGCCAVTYYIMQKIFSSFGFYGQALEQLNSNSTAMASLGAPPLKVHNIHLFDQDNYVVQGHAQLKIPVTGSKTEGYVYATSNWDSLINRWHLKQVFLKLREGETIEIFNDIQSDQ